MTDYRLTDEICEDLSSCITILTAPGDPDPYICPQYIADDMRAAADWQLEQVIEWLRDIHEEHIGLLAVIKDLQEAMRPTTQEDQ